MVHYLYLTNKTNILITFFTIPRPFTGLHKTIQKNAILSWKQLKPECEILLFGKELSIIQFSDKYNIKCVNSINVNSYGTPLLDGIWKTAKQMSKNDLVCYINSDIILFSDFTDKIKIIELNEYFMAGRRWDIDLMDEINFKYDWETNLIKLVNKKG